METTILSWNFTNWVTVVLMVFFAFLVFGVIGKTFRAVTSS